MIKLVETFTAHSAPPSGPAGSFEIQSGENGYSVLDKRTGKFLVEDTSSADAYDIARKAVERFDASMRDPVLTIVYVLWTTDGGGMGIKQNLKAILREPQVVKPGGFDVCEMRQAIIIGDQVMVLDDRIAAISVEQLDTDLLQSARREIEVAIAKLTPREIALLKNGNALRNA